LTIRSEMSVLTAKLTLPDDKLRGGEKKRQKLAQIIMT